LIVFALLFSSVIAVSCKKGTARVTHVIDGDTIVIQDEHSTNKVRLAYIDAPKIKQIYGNKSKEYLTQLIYGKTVTIKPITNDKYNRIIAEIYLNGRNINLIMIREGHAWLYRKYTDDKNFYDIGDNAENDAKAGKFGLWGSENFIPPCEFRKNY